MTRPLTFIHGPAMCAYRLVTPGLPHFEWGAHKLIFYLVNIIIFSLYTELYDACRFIRVPVLKEKTNGYFPTKQVVPVHNFLLLVLYYRHLLYLSVVGKMSTSHSAASRDDANVWPIKYHIFLNT